MKTSRNANNTKVHLFYQFIQLNVKIKILCLKIGNTMNSLTKLKDEMAKKINLIFVPQKAVLGEINL